MEYEAKVRSRGKKKCYAVGELEKDHQEQRCIIRDQGYDHPHPCIPNYYVQVGQ